MRNRLIPKLKDILNVLNEIAPFHYAEEWDNSGLQVGDLSDTVNKIFISLDPSISALQSALKGEAQLLLTHHPLIFKPLSQLDYAIYPGDVIVEAIRKKISIVSMHTNLDVAEGGINDMLANLFSIQNPEVLYVRDDLEIDGIGLGRIGDLSEPLGLSSIIKKVKGALGAMTVRVLRKEDSDIKRVAVVGGSGGNMVGIASRKGADLLITGDVSHHDALKAEQLGLALIDAGHFFSERAAMALFADSLQEWLYRKDMDVMVDVYRQEIGPMGYV